MQILVVEVIAVKVVVGLCTVVWPTLFVLVVKSSQSEVVFVLVTAETDLVTYGCSPTEVVTVS